MKKNNNNNNKKGSNRAPVEEHFTNDGDKPIEMLRASPVCPLLTVLEQDFYWERTVQP